MSEILPPDLEAWATAYTRDMIRGRELAHVDLTQVVVSNKEPSAPPFPDTLVVIRDDGGPRQSVLTGTRSMGVSVLAGTRLYDTPARELARLLFAILTDDDLPLIGGPDCPVVAVTDGNGPYMVDELQDRARAYFTVEYTVAGIPA